MRLLRCLFKETLSLSWRWMSDDEDFNGEETLKINRLTCQEMREWRVQTKKNRIIKALRILIFVTSSLFLYFLFLLWPQLSFKCDSWAFFGLQLWITRSQSMFHLLFHSSCIFVLVCMELSSCSSFSMKVYFDSFSFFSSLISLVFMASWRSILYSVVSSLWRESWESISDATHKKRETRRMIEKETTTKLDKRHEKNDKS